MWQKGNLSPGLPTACHQTIMSQAGCLAHTFTLPTTAIENPQTILTARLSAVSRLLSRSLAVLLLLELHCAFNKDPVGKSVPWEAAQVDGLKG